MKSQNQEYQFSSPNQQKNEKDILKYKHIQNDISVKLQSLSISLLDFMQKDDPKDRKANIQSRFQKQNRKLKDQNIKLISNNKYLQNQIKKFEKKQVQRLKNNNIDVSSQKQNKSAPQYLQDQIQLSQGSIPNRLDLIGCQEQKSSFLETQKMLNQARYFDKEDKYNLQILELYLYKFFDKLIRKLDLAEISRSYEGKQDMSSFNKVLVDKDVYKKLLEFYCDSVVIIKIRPQQLQPIDEIKPSKSILEEAIQNNILERHNNLQFFFENLAKKSGLEKEWRQYLKHSKDQSIRFRNKINDIINDPNDIYKPIRKNNNSQSNIQNDQIEKSRLNYRQQFFFFEKITQIVNLLDIDVQQKRMWQKLNQKENLIRCLIQNSYQIKLNKIVKK